MKPEDRSTEPPEGDRKPGGRRVAGTPAQQKADENRSLKAVAITMVAVACVVGVTLWVQSRPGLHLSEVLRRIEQAGLYTYQVSATITGEMAPGRSMGQRMSGTILVSAEHGTRVDMEVIETTSGRRANQVQYIRPQDQTITVVMPVRKNYSNIAFSDTQLARIDSQNVNPLTTLRRLLECDYQYLSETTIDDVTVRGFTTTDPRYLGGQEGTVDVKVWIDVQTQLPVRYEIDTRIEDRLQMQAAAYDFRWDIGADAEQFEPVIPSDYTRVADGTTPTATVDERTAIQGLRLFADLTGAYPEKLDVMSLMSQGSQIRESDTPAARELREQLQGLSSNEGYRRLAETMMPIQVLGSFYAQLVASEAEPVYYGHIVTPANADRVLLRWRTADGQYRVIFGDLRAETIDADAVAELEQDLPQ